MKDPIMKCCCYTVISLLTTLVTAFIFILMSKYYTNNSDEQTTAILGTLHTTTIAACDEVDCLPPVSMGNGDYHIDYLSDCTLCMEINCNPGYSKTLSNVSYCIDGEWFPPVEEKLCAKDCGQPAPESNTNVFYVHNQSIVGDTTTFAHGTELVYQCAHSSIYDSKDGGGQQHTRCDDGEWVDSGDKLECIYVNPAPCSAKDQSAAVVNLGVFCGLEMCVLVAIPLFYYRRIHQLGYKKRHPLRKTDSMIPLARQSTSLSTISGNRISPAKTKTDIAVIEDIDEDEYYTYAEVPDGDGDWVTPIKVEELESDHAKIIPAYLEIIQ